MGERRGLKRRCPRATRGEPWPKKTASSSANATVTTESCSAPGSTWTNSRSAPATPSPVRWIAPRSAAASWENSSREEAERVWGYVRQDMADAVAWVEESGEEFGQWLRFDLEQVEQRLMEHFLRVADRHTGGALRPGRPARSPVSAPCAARAAARRCTSPVAPTYRPVAYRNDNPSVRCSQRGTRRAVSSDRARHLPSASRFRSPTCVSIGVTAPKRVPKTASLARVPPPRRCPASPRHGHVARDTARTRSSWGCLPVSSNSPR